MGAATFAMILAFSQCKTHGPDPQKELPGKPESWATFNGLRATLAYRVVACCFGLLGWLAGLNHSAGTRTEHPLLGPDACARGPGAVALAAAARALSSAEAAEAGKWRSRFDEDGPYMTLQIKQVPLSIMVQTIIRGPLSIFPILGTVVYANCHVIYCRP